MVCPEQNPERSYDQAFIDAVEGQPFIAGLREIGAQPDTIRAAAHGILDRALNEMGIPRPQTHSHMKGWLGRHIKAYINK